MQISFLNANKELLSEISANKIAKITLQIISPLNPPATSNLSFTANVLTSVSVSPSDKFPG